MLNLYLIVLCALIAPSYAIKQILPSPIATLTATPGIIYNNSQLINVSWTGINFATPFDWIGVFPLTVLQTQGIAPMQFRNVSTYYDQPPSDGWMAFNMENHRTECIFVYVTGTAQFVQAVVRSNTVSYYNLDEPIHIHTAIQPGGTGLHVMWVQRRITTPTVKYGTASGVYDKAVVAVNVTLSRTDFCDQDLQPAANQGWIDPGTALTATLTDLTPSTVYYYVVTDVYGTSVEFNFTSPPPVGATEPFSFVALADLGQSPPSNLHGLGYRHHTAGQHSWDFGDRGELPARNTTKHIYKHVVASGGKTRLVVHIGDISYAVGYQSEWDNFMTMIQPVASLVPYMVGIGNHEHGWNNSFVGPSQDSGGECGLSYALHFPYASQAAPDAPLRDHANQPWYSFDHASAHIVMLSTEHDFTAGSDQLLWLENELKSVNRDVTPWLIVTGHRPLYSDTTFPQDQMVAAILKENVEPILLKYKVDLYLAGHQHLYQRTCRVNNGTCVDRQNATAVGKLSDQQHGIVHMIIGMAGYDLSKDLSPTPAPWVEFGDDGHWGFIVCEVANKTHMDVSFFDSNSGALLDKFPVDRA